jgi:hypothetical protein
VYPLEETPERLAFRTKDGKVILFPSSCFLGMILIVNVGRFQALLDRVRLRAEDPKREGNHL